LEIFNIEYDFFFDDDKTNVINYKLVIDKNTKTIVESNFTADSNQSWTDLDFYQCNNCPLKVESTLKCPIAVHLNSLVKTFSDKISYTEIEIQVITDQRTYSKKASFQYGLQSLFGLVMATSGCPHMQFFSKMALFHLPFSNMEETMIRATSFYLLDSYFNQNLTEEDAFNLDGLKKIYNQVEEVNHGIIRRIRSIIQEGDATQNAISTLNSFAQMFNVQYEIDLQSYSYIFKDLHKKEAN
jgi:hypothetical protein